MVTSRIWLYVSAEGRAGSDGSKVRRSSADLAGTGPPEQDRRSADRILTRRYVFVSKAERPGARADEREEIFAGSRRVSQYALLHEVSGDPHRQYVARSHAMAVHKRIVQPGLTSMLGSERCARSSVAWHALDGYGGGWRKSWRCNGRRSR